MGKRSLKLYYAGFIALFLCVFCLKDIIAQSQPAVLKYRIGNVQIIGIDDQYKQDRVRNTARLFPGQEKIYEDFGQAVKMLWNTGNYRNIQIKTEEQTGNLMHITIYIEENPQLDFVRFFGNQEVKEDELKTALNYYPSQYISEFWIRNAKQRLKDFYYEKGFLLAEVDVDSTEAVTPDRIALVFNVNEGEKVKLKKIFYEGNETFTDGKLRKQFKETKQDGWFSGGDFSPSFFKEDKKLLVDFYRKNGFRDMEVVGDSIYYGEDRKSMFLVVKVREGIRYYYRNIDFVINEDEFGVNVIRQLFGISKGDVYDAEKMEKGVEAVNGFVNDFGYLNALVNIPEQPVGIDSVDVTLYMDEGNIVTIDMIEIRGNTKTKEKVIRREIDLLPGEKYSQDKMIRSITDIQRLNYFAKVMPNVGMTDDVDKINLIFEVEEKSTDTANMAAGYSERDGMIGSLGLAMNNFMGNGQQLSLDWQFGRIYRAFQIGFTEPYLFDTPTMAGFSIYDMRRGGSYYGYNLESEGITLRLGRRLSWPDDWFLGNWYFEYSRNRYYNIQDDSVLRQFFIGRENTTRAAITQIMARDSRRFNPEFYEGGSRIALSTTFSGKFLGGTEHFLKNVLSMEWYYRTFWEFVFYNKSEFGWINSLSSDDYISPQDLFFLGGSALSLGTSLRGYKERSVGPMTPDGYPLGGKAMTKFSSELRFQMSESPTIYGLFFAEVGNNWHDNSFIDYFDLKRSAGAGIRLFLPMVGMLGIDFGYGFDNYDQYGNKKGKWMPQFQFGRGF
ncbi:outer membrane protein assembly factor BamA [candidate division KSB1 bacterium]